MFRLLLIATLSATAPALAQGANSLQLQVGSGKESFVIPRTGCDGSVTASWTVTLLSQPCADLALWVTQGECEDKAGAADLQLSGVPVATLAGQGTGTLSIPARDLPAFKGEKPASCGDPVEKRHKLCGAFKTTTTFGGECNSVVKDSSPPSIVYDGKPPDPPVIEQIDAQDSALLVRFSSVEAALIHLEFRAQGEEDFSRTEPVSASLATARITGLSNNTTYEVRALAEDSAGNVSAPSEVAAATPIRTEGFFAAFLGAGGTTQGCTAAGGSALPFLVLGMLGLVSSRRMRP